MLLAVRGTDVTEKQATQIAERFGDTPYPIVVEPGPRGDRVAAVVLISGERGYELARHVANAMQSAE